MKFTTAAAVAAIATLLGSGVATALPVTAQQSKPDLPVWTTRPCPTEDSVNCRWVADERGDGKGHSFVVREVPGSAHMVCVFYVDRKYAKRHDYCA